ncbi:unnamed protein product, partial [Parascedosporium putredinis]
YEDRLSMHRQ